MPPAQSEKSKALAQLVKSMLSSLAGFSLDFASLAALVEFARVPYQAAAVLSFVAGTSLVYILSTSWVFSQRRFKNRRLEYFFFLIGGAAGLVLNVLLIVALTELLGLHYLVSKTASGLCVFLFNFAARKYWIFTPAEGRADRSCPSSLPRP